MGSSYGLNFISIILLLKYVIFYGYIMYTKNSYITYMIMYQHLEYKITILVSFL